MTQKIFWEDPYLTELETTITTVQGNQITVSETIFYAFSGGQESDYGIIGGKKVLEARKQDKGIIYTIEQDHGLKVGQNVLMCIDWNRRYRLMRLHFAAEVVLELVYQKFPKIEKIGAHISAEKARIDFIWDDSFSAFIASLQDEAQKIIDSNQEIVTGFSDEASQKRFWRIQEFAEVPCGGTHVKRTGEIGQIKLKRVNPGKGKERIEIFVDT